MKQSLTLLGFLTLEMILGTPVAISQENAPQPSRVFQTHSRLLAQNSGAEARFVQMNQSMNQAFQEMMPFLQGVSQLDAVQTDEQLLALAQQLLPLATRIQQNFNQAYQAGNQVVPMLPANAIETKYLDTIVAMNGLGALAMSPWVEIFTSVQQAYQTQNPALLKNAISKIPEAAQKLVTFGNQVQSVVNQGQQIASYLNSQATAAANRNLSPSQAQFQSNMSRMMHETNMSIINNMGSDGAWRYNYSTGQDEYKYY